MTQPTYTAGRVAAARIHAHFVRHVSAPSPRQGGEAAASPDTTCVEAMIEAAFWASLRREEGYLPRILLVFVAPDAVKSPLKFEPPLPLARLALAVERPGIHLGVWHDGEQFCVWGAAGTLPASCFVLEVIGLEVPQ